VKEGECCTDVCTRNLDPVCGEDGRTYGNRCMACGVNIVRKGACIWGGKK